MNLLLVVDQLDRAQPLLGEAEKTGKHQVRTIGLDEDFVSRIEESRPEILILHSGNIAGDVLAKIKLVTHRRAMPVIVFTDDSRTGSIDAAVRAGVTAYVVDCADPARLDSLVEVAKARFEEQQRLKEELLKTKHALNERKLVERAKGIIMDTKGLSEDQAYKVIRKMAMNHNRRVGEVAEQIISAAEILI